MELPVVRPYRPVRLERLNQKLAALPSAEPTDPAKRQRIRDTLLAALVIGTRPWLPRSELSVLLDMVADPDFGRLDEPLKDRAIEWLKEQASRLRPRALLGLFSVRVEGFAARLLLERIATSLRRGRSVGLPLWLPQSSYDDAKRVLTTPRSYLFEFVGRNKISLARFTELTEIRASTQLGQDVLIRLIERGAQRWWKAQGDAFVREWSENHSLEIVSAVATRQLSDLRGAGKAPRELAQSSKALFRWLDERLGHPDIRPQRWIHIPPPLQDFVRRAFVADQIERIMRAFRRVANPDRAEFWEAWSEEISDAQLVATTPAVCLMRIGTRLFVEFAHTGYALHVFPAPERSLASALHEMNLGPNDFREKARLRLRGTSLPFEKRFSHHVGWEANVAAYIEGRGDG